jgi:6-phospho-beta-glucosidase
MKLTIIGGGSTYSPELIEGLIRRHQSIGLHNVTLMDIDEKRLEVVGGFAKRMVAHAKAPFTVTLTNDRAAAIDGSDFVVTQIRVGQMPARHKDILLGLRHDLIGQETTGVGGFAKALRTIPAMVDIARDIQTRAPEAWLINFTNPSGLITEALHRAGITRLIGLCNIPIGMVMDLALYLQCDPDKIKIDYVGLNHLSWVRKVWLEGEDITERIIAALGDQKGPANIPELHYAPEFVKALGFIPSPYLRYFYATSTMLAELKAKDKTRAEEVMEVEKALLAKYADPAIVTKPEELEKRGGAFYSKIAVDLVDAIWNDKGETHVVNVPNRGSIVGIGADQTVEIPAVIRRDGAHALPVGEVEPKIMGLIQQVKAYETLAVEAGLENSYDKALMALAAHPLCPTEKAVDVLDDIIATHGLTLKKG